MVSHKKIFKLVSLGFMIMIFKINAHALNYIPVNPGNRVHSAILGKIEPNPVRSKVLSEQIDPQVPGESRALDITQKDKYDIPSESSAGDRKVGKPSALHRPIAHEFGLRSVSDRPGTPKPGREVAKQVKILPLVGLSKEADTPLFSLNSPKQQFRDTKRKDKKTS